MGTPHIGMGRDMSIFQIGESPYQYGVHSNLGTNIFSRGCLRNSRQAVVSTCVLFFSAMVGTFLVVVLTGNCWRRTQCFMTTIIFFTTTVTLRITSKGVLTSSNSPRSSIFLKSIYSCCGINLVELTRHHCVTKM